jgi:hypothetical protein
VGASGAEEKYAPYDRHLGDPASVGAAMKGDRVEIVIDAGGNTKTYEVTATRAGRRVEVVNRSGVVVRTARFMASRVLALVEHPAPRRPEPSRRPASAASAAH